MTERELTVVGLTEDKTKLVLVGDSGDEFTVAADAKLRAALRGDNARPGQLEIQMESVLRPRDIQARIRAGESPEVVAAAAQTTVDRIMNYAMPVLAERAHVAERAQRASVRRRAGEGPGGVLGDAIVERLRSRNVAPESVEWDAWRRDDGRWSLTASYSGATAAFVYDAAGRYVVAEDDESRWLVGERTGQSSTLGEDAIELVSEAPADSTTDLTETARPLRAVPADELPITLDSPDADWFVTQASERPEEPQEAPARPAKKAKGRASVPSWDEIMFGSGGD